MAVERPRQGWESAFKIMHEYGDDELFLDDWIEEKQEGEVITHGSESRDLKIEKYLSKFKVAYPNDKQPTYEEVGILIDQWDSIGRHITYPLAGTAWNQIEWQREYDRKKELEKRNTKYE